MARRKFKWTKHQLNKLSKIQYVLEELEDYKPLTLRQIYYQLVGKSYIPNNNSQYTMLSELLKWARIDRRISWEDIEDRVRTYHNLTGWSDSDFFVRASLKHFLGGYRRNLLHSQKKYIEIWIEKDALSFIFTRVATRYTVPVIVCKGFSSISFLNDFRDRLNYQNDKKPVMLYFGDFDPSGLEMLESMKTTLRKELSVIGIEFKRIALLKDDIYTYKLPHNLNALKKSDTRTGKYVKTYGKLAVELDALRPDVLEKKIKEAIEAELDMKVFKVEKRTCQQEFDKLNKLKEEVTDFVNECLDYD